MQRETQHLKPERGAERARSRLFGLSRPRHSVRGKMKLLLLATTALALAIAGAALLLTDLRRDRQTWATDLSTEAEILAFAVAPALSFGDHASAVRNLQALRARPSIRAAALYTPDGALYAYYAPPNAAQPPLRVPVFESSVLTDGGRIELVRSIVQSQETLGFLYLAAQYDLSARIGAYVGVLVVVLLLSLAVAFFAFARLQRIITVPLESMARVARSIIEHRDYSLRATKMSEDEVGLVLDAFNNMLDEVQSHARALQSSNERLQRTEQALLEAHRRKDEFLATLAHELRNPLAPIRNAVRILDLPSASESQRVWGRQVIARQVRHMALLLDDLLDLSRVTRGRLELKKEYADLHSIVEAALETAKPLFDAKQQQVKITMPQENLRLEVDPLRLSQILANLLTNAAKYTDPQGSIAFGFTRDARGITFSVRDSGIGLAPENIPGLFNMFSQVSSSLDRAEGGLGIGLALVKGLVELHGGTVEARSEGLGKGSEFLVHLPTSVIATSGQAPRQRTDGEVSNVDAHRKVLVVDDNHDAADTLATMLKLAGYKVQVASSGHEALERAATERPDAILLDIGLPGMSGFDVARAIRSEAWGREIILIALTGWGQEHDKAKASAVGFNEHLTKPADPAVIETLLAQFLAVPRSAMPVDPVWPHKQ